MSLPVPEPDEQRQQFINRFMHDAVAMKNYPKRVQRENAAIIVWDQTRPEEQKGEEREEKSDAQG